MSYVIKFQAPFERLKTYHSSPDVSLRRAIILQAIIDASNTTDTKEAKKIENEAKAWLFGKSEDFTRTCYEGDFEPDFIVKIAKEVISLQQHNIKRKRTKDNSNKENNIFSAVERLA